MKRKLGELLIEAGAVASEDVEAALADQSAGEPSRLGDLLLSTGKITPAALARALAMQHDLAFADLSYVAPEASGLIPLEFQRAHRLVPFRLDRDGGATRVHIAIADPTLSDVVDELRSQLKREVIVHVAAIDDIENVHAALAGEAGEPVVMGEVLDEEVFMSPEPAVTSEVLFEEPPSGEFPFPAAPPADFFGEPAADAAEQSAPPFIPSPVEGRESRDPDVFEHARTVETPVVDLFAFPDDPASGPPGPFEFPAAPAPDAAAPAHVTEEELFGSLDLAPSAEVSAPLSTDLADEIGRHDLAPPQQDYVGFSALSAPLGDPGADRFGARASMPDPVPPDPVALEPEAPLTAEPGPLLDAEVEPMLEGEPFDAPIPAPLSSPILDLGPKTNESTQKFAGNLVSPEAPRIPSFAIPPEVPVEPRRSPVEPLRRPATLGRIALKRVAVNREGVAVAMPPEVKAPAPEPIVAAAAPELELPEWMRTSSDPSPVIPLLPTPEPGELSAMLVALLSRVETGDLPAGPTLAALVRLLVERRVLDDAATAAALEKL